MLLLYNKFIKYDKINGKFNDGLCKQYNELSLNNTEKVKFYMNQIRKPKITNEGDQIDAISNICNIEEEPVDCIKKIQKIDNEIK